MKRTLSDYLPLPGRLEWRDGELTGLVIADVRLVVSEVMKTERAGEGVRMTLRTTEGAYVEACRASSAREWVVERLWPTPPACSE